MKLSLFGYMLIISLIWKLCFMNLHNTVRHEWNGIYAIRLKLSRFNLSSECSYKVCHCQAFEVDWVRKETPWEILYKNNIFIDDGHNNRILTAWWYFFFPLSYTKDNKSSAILNFFLAFSCFSKESLCFPNRNIRLSLSFSAVSNLPLHIFFFAKD